MRYLVLGLLGFISLILQSTIFNELIIAGVKPDLILIIVIFFALFNGPWQGSIVGLGLGFLEDILFAKYIGLNALTKFFIGLIVGLIEKRMYKDNFLVPLICLFLGSIIYSLLYFICANLTGYPLSFIQLLHVSLPMAIYNTCFAPFIYGGFYKASTKGVLKA